MANIATNERRWLLIATITALVLANLPMALGFITAPQGTVYTGIDSIAPGDVNVYLSYLEQVRQGHFVFRDLYTAEPHAPTIVNPFWLALGMFGSILNLPNLAVYFLSRVVLGALLLFFIYYLAAQFFDDVVQRKIAFMIAVFGSGVGAWAAPFIDAWFRQAVPGSAWPMDLWVSEAFTWLSLHHSPHFLAATILILLSVWLLIRSTERLAARPAALAGLSMLALFSFHPFHLVSLGLVTAAFLVVLFIRDRPNILAHVGRLGIAWLVASPAIVYQVWLVLRDPLAAGRVAQNILLTTWPWVTVLSYGALLILGIAGAVMALRQRSLRWHLLTAWFIAQAASIYAPIFFNRRLTQGLNVAMALLAAAAVVAIHQRLFSGNAKRKPIGVFTAVIGLFLFGMSNLWVMAQDLSFILGRDGRSSPYYFFLDRDYRNAFRWLTTNGTDNDVVLSSSVTGNFIPGWSGRRVVIGHDVETIQFKTKQRDVIRFYDASTSDEWRTTWLKSNGVTLVVVGPREAKLGAYDGTDSTWLKPVFASATVKIYGLVTVPR